MKQCDAGEKNDAPAAPGTYRSVSVEGCQVLGRGANAVVYRLDPETVVKVYHDFVPLEDIEQERRLAHLAFFAGIPTAISFDVVRVGDSYGSVFELLDAHSYAELLRTGPGRLDELAERAAALLRTIHAAPAQPGTLPDQREKALGWVRRLEGSLDAPRLEKLRRLVEAVPRRNFMLHGDFHVKNLLLQKGETLLIDMDTLCAGDPIFELEGIYSTHRGFGLADRRKVTDFLGLPWEICTGFVRKTLSLYLGNPPEERVQAAEDKAALLSCTRLASRILHKQNCARPEVRAELDRYLEALRELLDRTDSLTL